MPRHVSAHRHSYREKGSARVGKDRTADGAGGSGLEAGRMPADGVASASTVPDDCQVPAMHAADWVRRVSQHQGRCRPHSRPLDHVGADPLLGLLRLCRVQRRPADEAQVPFGRDVRAHRPSASTRAEVPRTAGAADQEVKDRSGPPAPTAGLVRAAGLQVEQIRAGRLAVLPRKLEPTRRQTRSAQQLRPRPAPPHGDTPRTARMAVPTFSPSSRLRNWESGLGDFRHSPRARASRPPQSRRGSDRGMRCTARRHLDLTVERGMARSSASWPAVSSRPCSRRHAHEKP